jgi:threonine/homoserine/homoserine lactone efflux protein
LSSAHDPRLLAFLAIATLDTITRVRRALDRVTGAVLVGLGLRVAREAR